MGYWSSLIASTLAQGLLAAAVAFAWGRGGVLILGPALFFGIGAYAVSLPIFPESIFAGASWYGGMAVGLFVSIAITAMAGVLTLGRPGGLLRFAAATLVLSLLAEKVAVRAYSWTGGSNGMLVDDRAYLPWLSAQAGFEWIALLVPGALCALALLLIALFDRSDAGRFLVLSRDAPDSVARLGLSIGNVRLFAAIFSAAVAAIAGSLYAPATGIVSPDVFVVANSMQCLAWVVLGGLRPLGAFVASCAMRFVEVQLGAAFADWYLLLIAVVLIGAVLYRSRSLEWARS